MKTPPPLPSTTAAIAALVALSLNAAHAVPVVSESFAYVEGSTIPGQGGVVDGWAGPWQTSGGTNQEFETVVSGLTFGDLEVAGGACQRSARFGRQAMSREVSATAQAALTADNSTIWFSVLMQGTAPTDPLTGGGFATNSYGTLVFASAPFNEASGAMAPPITAGGSAIGVGFGDTSDNLGDYNNLQVQGVTYNAGVLTESIAERVVVGGDSTILVVGSVDWAATGTDDVLNLYLIDDLTAALPMPFVTMVADLDQSTFNVVSIGDAQTSVFDEIRFGLSLSDVLGELPEPFSLEVTEVTYDAASDPGNIIMTVTFSSELGKTYTLYTTSDLTTPVTSRGDLDDSIVGADGTTTVVINFDDSFLDKSVREFFVVVQENPPAP